MRLRERLWNPYLLVFTTSACLMVIELVASRLIATRVGVSLYTWTAIIGVILAGVSLGNYGGGQLADRRASSGLLGTVLALGALTGLLILWLNNDLHEINLPATIPFMVWILLYVAAVFMLPSVCLGCVSPIVTQLTLLDLHATGRTVGLLSACSSLGSIVGTFATGFALISLLGAKNAILLVCGLLLLLALWFLTDAPWRRAAWRALLVLALFGVGVALLARTGFLCSECLRETNYFCINVQEDTTEGRPVRALLLDRLVHSYSDVNDPTFLGYGYERDYAGLMRPLMVRKPNLDAYFVGGGGYTFPRYLEVTLPQSHLVVAEIDPGVTKAAHLWLGLPRDTRIETHNRDARQDLAGQKAEGAYDIVFGDAFNDFSVPYHLTTLEFDRLVARALRDDGLYVANIIDGGKHGHFLRAFVHTLQQVFAHVAVIPSQSGWREEARTTFVVAASQRPLDLSSLSGDSVPLSEAQLNAYLAQEEHLLLTDDHVPVDNLMAPVVEDSFFASTWDAEIAGRVGERVQAVGYGLLAVTIMVVAWLVYRRRRARRPSHPEST